VGGGFSGLVVAHLLQELLDDAPELSVFEASPRLGGRIWTRWIEEAGCYYDAGAAEFYDIRHSPGLRNLVDKLGLARQPMVSSPPMYFRGQLLRSEQDLLSALGPEAFDDVQQFWERAMRLRPPEEYAAAGHTRDNDHPWFDLSFEQVLKEVPHPTAREFLAAQSHSDLAASPSDTSGLFGFDNLLIDHPDYCSMYTLVDGNERLVDALAASLSAELLLSMTVERVEAGAEAGTDVGWRVHLRRDDSREERAVDFLIASPHPHELCNIAWSEPRVAEAIRKHAEHYCHWAAYLRVTLVTQDKFWGGDLAGDYFMTDAFSGTTIYDRSADANGRGVLSWLIAGNPAAEMMTWNDEAVVDAVLAELPPELERVRQELCASRVDAWSGPRGVSRLPGGRPLIEVTERHFPVRDLTRFAILGDYLYDSTLCGALEGACFVAARLASAIDPQKPVSAADALRCLSGSEAQADEPATATVASSLFPFPEVSKLSARDSS
jgi:monoamine oxidase